MDNLLSSQAIEAMINTHMQNIINDGSPNGALFNLLNEQQQEISPNILVTDPIYKDGHYFYTIKAQNMQVERRYGEFEMLSEYLFKTSPETLQKNLPPKETYLNYLKSYVSENKQILSLRKEKFQIYLNDLKKKLTNNKVFNDFLTNPKSFEEQMRVVDPSILQSQGYIEKVMKFGQVILGKDGISQELKDQHQLLQVKIMHLDQIQSYLIILYLNLLHKTKSSQIAIQNKEVQDLINSIIENQEQFQKDNIVNKIERLTKKVGEVIEMFPNIRIDKMQFDSYDKLLEECLNLIITILKELQQ